MKKFLTSRIFAFILGAIIFGGIVGVSAYTIFANDIGYTPKDTTWEVDNVKDAIDDLYSKAKPEYTGTTTITPTTSIQTLPTKDKILTKNITINAIPSTYQQTIDNLQEQIAFYEQSSNSDCISKTFTATSDYTTDNGKKIIDFNPSSFNLYVKLTSGIKIYQMYNNLDNSWKSFAIFTDGTTENQSEIVTFSSRYKINNGLYFHNMASGWIDSNIYIMACK